MNEPLVKALLALEKRYYVTGKEKMHYLESENFESATRTERYMAGLDSALQVVAGYLTDEEKSAYAHKPEDLLAAQAEYEKAKNDLAQGVR